MGNNACFKFDTIVDIFEVDITTSIFDSYQNTFWFVIFFNQYKVKKKKNK